MENLNELKTNKQEWKKGIKGALPAAALRGSIGVFGLSALGVSGLAVVSSTVHVINGNVNFNNPMTYAAIIGVGAAVLIAPISKKIYEVSKDELIAAKECIRFHFIGKKRIDECSKEIEQIERQIVLKLAQKNFNNGNKL